MEDDVKWESFWSSGSVKAYLDYRKPEQQEHSEADYENAEKSFAEEGK